MIPPVFRRCPECGRTTWSGRFAVVASEDGRQRVECPRCGHRFEAIDSPLRK